MLKYLDLKVFIAIARLIGSDSQFKAKSTTISMESKPEIEYIHVKLTFNNTACKPLDVIGIYHPPNSTLLQSFFDHLEIIMDSLDTNTNQILAGDFNICGLTNNPISNQLFNLMRSYLFMPHISRITRTNPNTTSTAIDHIWSNFGTNFESGVFDEVIITDHLINFVFLPLIVEKMKIQTRFRDHSEQCIQKLIDSLTNFELFFPLLTANLNFENKFDLFYDEINRLYNACCPVKVKEIAIKNIKKPWISHDIIQMISTKHILFSNYKRGCIPYSEFQTYQKNLQKTINVSKQNYFRHKFQTYRGNSAKTWKLTNNILGKSKNISSSVTLVYEDNLINNEQEIANIFNNYFVNIGNDLVRNINSDIDPLYYMGNRTVNSFVFQNTNANEVRKIIENFKNKSTTVNNIPIFVLKKNISHYFLLIS